MPDQNSRAPMTPATNSASPQPLTGASAMAPRLSPAASFRAVSTRTLSRPLAIPAQRKERMLANAGAPATTATAWFRATSPTAPAKAFLAMTATTPPSTAPRPRENSVQARSSRPYSARATKGMRAEKYQSRYWRRCWRTRRSVLGGGAAAFALQRFPPDAHQAFLRRRGHQRAVPGEDLAAGVAAPGRGIRAVEAVEH